MSDIATSLKYAADRAPNYSGLMLKAANEIESLQSRIAELEAENDRLKEENNQLEDDCGYQMQWKREFNEQLEYCKGQLAASQLRETQLRDALRDTYIELFHCDQQMTHTYDEDGEPMWHTGSTVTMALEGAKELLDNLTDTSALDAYVAEKVKEAMK